MVFLILFLSIQSFGFVSTKQTEAMQKAAACRPYAGSSNECKVLRSNPGGAGIRQSLVLACQSNLQKHKCAELKSSPESLLKCSEDEVCKNLDSDLADIVLGCGEGFYNFGKEKYENLKKTLAEIPKNIEANNKCNEDLSQKRNFFEEYNKTVPPILQREPIHETSLKGMLCTEVIDSINRYYLSQVQVAERNLISFETQNPRLKNQLDMYPLDLHTYKEWRDEKGAEQAKRIRDGFAALAKTPEVIQQLLGALEIRYECYNLKAKTEIVCKALAPQISEMVLGAGAGFAVAKLLDLYNLTKSKKVLEQINQLKAAENKSEVKTERRGFREAQTTAEQAKRQAFMSQYAEKEVVSKKEKAEWKALADSVPAGSSQPDLQFVTLKNSQVGALNNDTKQEDLVTAINHLRQEKQLNHIRKLEKELQKDDPDLKIVCFNNHSLLNCGVKGKIPDDFNERMEGLTLAAQLEFELDLKARHKIIFMEDSTEKWFRNVVASSDDEAQFAERYARTREPWETVDADSLAVRKWGAAKLEEVKTTRANLEKQLSHTSLLEKVPGQPPVLKTSAIDIIRKSEGDTEKAREALKKEFGLRELSSDTVVEMKKHVDALKNFSPDPRVVDRGIASLRNSEYGGIAVDMKKLGAENLNVTSKAVAKSTNLDEALRMSRAAEQDLTKQIDARRESFKKIVQDQFPESERQFLNVQCSGDGCTAFHMKRELSLQEVKNINQGLANTGESGRMRLSSQSAVKDIELRDNVKKRGEDIEKDLVKSLSGAMDPKRVEGLVIGVHMGAQKPELILSEARGLRLSPTERALIQKKFDELHRSTDRPSP